MKRLSTLLLVLLGIAALTLAAACSDDDDDDDATTPTTTATATATQENGGTATATQENGGGDDGGGTTAVKVSLSEFMIDPDAATAPAGEVEFDATNDGSLPHELVVVRSDEAVDALPTDGGLVDESAVDVVGEIEPFDAGTTASASFNLEPGHYILLCNVPGHYEAGMRTEFTVE